MRYHADLRHQDTVLPNRTFCFAILPPPHENHVDGHMLVTVFSVERDFLRASHAPVHLTNMPPSVTGIVKSGEVPKISMTSKV